MSKSKFAESLEALDPEQLERVAGDIANEKARRGQLLPPDYSKMTDMELQEEAYRIERGNADG